MMKARKPVRRGEPEDATSKLSAEARVGQEAADKESRSAHAETRGRRGPSRHWLERNVIDAAIKGLRQADYGLALYSSLTFGVIR